MPTKPLTPEQTIRKHLGKDIITKTMAREMLAEVKHVGWILRQNRKGTSVYYSCCGKTASSTDREYPTAILEASHRRYAPCPFCGKNVLHLNCNHIRQDDRHETFHTFYRKSHADNKTLVVIGAWCGVRRHAMAHVDMDWREAKARALVPEMEPATVTILPLGGKPVQYMRVPRMLREKTYSMGWSDKDENWSQTAAVRGGRLAALYTSSIRKLVHTDWISRATLGTAWAPLLRKIRQVKVIPNYDYDLIQTLSTLARHPQIEYMLQGGLMAIARAAITGVTAGCVNWRGKTMQAMLRLDSNELARLKRMEPGKVKLSGLWLRQQAGKNGEAAKMETCMELCARGHVGRAYKKAITAYGKRYGVMRIAKAFDRWFQMRMYAPADLWLDYIDELQKLREAGDLSRVFPKNLYEAHAQTSQRIRLQADKIKDEQIAQRLGELRKLYHFEAAGLVLEPFETTKEIIAEGAGLRICIGSYCDSYVNGNTVLLKLRRKEDTKTPFHAVEINKNGVLVQCRGYQNMTWPKDAQQVRDFWAAWNEKHKRKQEVHLDINYRTKEEEACRA